MRGGQRPNWNQEIGVMIIAKGRTYFTMIRFVLPLLD